MKTAVFLLASCATALVPIRPATRARLALRPGDFAVLKPPPSKADQFGMRWGSKPIWLPFDAGARICAAAALAR